MAGSLASALRALEAARLLARRGFHAESVSRAYYATFYAAREAVRSTGAEPGTHRGVAVEFSRLFVLSGRVPSEPSKALRRLATKRADADYDDRELTAESSLEAIRSAEGFVREVARALGATEAVAPAWSDLTDDQKRDLVAQLTREIDAAAQRLESEKAAELRDSIAQIEASWRHSKSTFRKRPQPLSSKLARHR